MNIAILSRKPNLYSTRRLVEEAEKLGHKVTVIDHTKCHLLMQKGKPAIKLNGEEVKDIDVIVPRIGASVTQYGATVIRHFDLLNVPSVLTAAALIRSRDKLRSLQVLSKSGVGIPKSVFARHPKSNDVKNLIGDIGSMPVILKLLEGTHGTGVIKADSIASAKSAVEAFSGIKKDLIVQEFIEEADGADIRAFVVDGKVVGAMQRKGVDGEFRSNLHKGGVAQIIELDKKTVSLALEATKLLGLNVAGVDILMSKRGPLVVEVNSSPGLQGIEKATGVNIAKSVIEVAQKKYEKTLALKEKNKTRNSLKKKKKRAKKDGDE